MNDQPVGNSPILETLYVTPVRPTSFEGRLSFPVNPGNITVRSSAGGSASASVTAR